MSTNEARYHLQQTKRKYLVLRLTETFVSSASLFFLLLTIFRFTSIGNTAALFASLSAGTLYFIIRSFQLDIFRIKEQSVAHYINHTYPQMEESTDLLLVEDDGLTPLQQLQKFKSIQRFQSLYPKIKLPNKLGMAFILFLASFILYIILTTVYQRNEIYSSVVNSETRLSATSTKLPAAIREGTITIIPPRYTGNQPQKTNNFKLSIPEGTTIQWNLSFTEQVISPYLIFSGKDSIQLKLEKENQFQAQRTFHTTGFYQVVWRNPDSSTKHSDYYPIEVIQDQPPNIQVENINHVIELNLNDNLNVNLKSNLTDDYGLRDAYIIATVSKGSGESVKFREERLRFEKPLTIAGRNVTSIIQIDLRKLGLDPGDELYFYVEALDNKEPLSNKGRTETFFISLQDTSSISTSVDPGLGVDLMPEYFRSQRQIIIDSEKLLKEKKRITKESFNSRSNELGYDQKVLRLRYGQFLGEEFESGIGPQAEIHDEKDHDEEDITKKYGHIHDKDNEHNHVDDTKSPAKSDPGHTHQEEESKTDPAKAYMHMHDMEEEATFFTQSIRTKLKAAITIMWDAELYLRLYEPEKSLPFQYKALKLLKEVSQDSRIYVHRTGFDPPPLKEEKRLTGDLSEIKNSTGQYKAPDTENYPDIRRALEFIELLLPKREIRISDEAKSIFAKAGQELSTAALEQPGRYLTTLSLLKMLTEDELDQTALRSAMEEIRSACWNVIPPENTSPQASYRIKHTLEKRFLNNLNALKRD
jgi:hypothetical protein